MSLRVLFAASEVHPLVKTGGLADVAASLPAALARRGAELRIALPAYRGWRERVSAPRRVARLAPFEVWEAPHPESGVPLWLFEAPALFDRPGTPYEDEQHRPWPDNGLRFGGFARAVAQLAAAGAAGFTPQVLHAHDWHTGLAVAWLRQHATRPASVFTIHNLAYQGVFPALEAHRLQLPESWWHMEGVEFHGQLSHMKAGIVYADALTTVSPTYAREIQQPEAGHGLDGLLRAHASRLTGIANGIDAATWDPATDPHLAKTYAARTLAAGKRANRAALRAEVGLPADDGALLVGLVSRFAQQKGIDLLVEAAPALRELPLQFVILGRGEPAVTEALRAWQRAAPRQVALCAAHDEPLAHRIIAGSDAFLMPSRYEPCGLTQMYSQRYGTVPVVRRTGGLADTVVDATPTALRAGAATGIHFEHADAGGVIYGLRRALELHRKPRHWRALQRAGMARDFSWTHVAGEYLALYESLLP